MMIIRPETQDDLEKIRNINSAAFATNDEANLVDALRKSGAPLISLVAEEKGELIGHIIFSPVSLEGNQPSPFIAGLGPMAAIPECKNKGVGSRLVEEGLRHCKTSGYKAVVVLGHPEYYPRFGFVPSVNYDIKSEYQVPPEIFMIKELEEFALKGFNGTVKYHQAFSDI
ncbi:MAG: N-acetyltransferase [ANME-2 cluster archaeon]|nr:N-acetyltransferase [ANME-2 cluster archaeon]MDF1531401.1 N-acetyltransferase [ANME-2 cluster archaeon]